MTDLDRLIAYWPAYRDSLASATNIEEAEKLLRTHHDMGPGAFQDLMTRVKSLATSVAEVKPATIVG